MPPTPAGASISSEDLAAQLKARMEAKARRDFPTADSIRSALEPHGIRITDVSKTWFASDGRSGNTVGPDFFTPSGVGYGGALPPPLPPPPLPPSRPPPPLPSPATALVQAPPPNLALDDLAHRNELLTYMQPSAAEEAKLASMGIRGLRALFEAVRATCPGWSPPIEAASRGLVLTVPRGKLITWMRSHLSQQTRLCMTEAVRDGVVASGGVRPKEWVGYIELESRTSQPAMAMVPPPTLPLPLSPPLLPPTSLPTYKIAEPPPPPQPHGYEAPMNDEDAPFLAELEGDAPSGSLSPGKQPSDLCSKPWYRAAPLIPTATTATVPPPILPRISPATETIPPSLPHALPCVPDEPPAEPTSDASVGTHGVSLISIGSREPGRVVRLPASGSFEIGRLESCDLTLAEMAVSASHCKIYVRFAEGGCKPTATVEDCSTNGTYLGAERIAKGKRVELADGDRLGLLRPCGRDARGAGAPPYIYEVRIRKMPPNAHSGNATLSAPKHASSVGSAAARSNDSSTALVVKAPPAQSGSARKRERQAERGVVEPIARPTSEWQIVPYRPQQPRRLPVEGSGAKTVVLPAGADPLNQVHPSSRYTKQTWTVHQYNNHNEKLRGKVAPRLNAGRDAECAANMQAAAAPPAPDAPLTMMDWSLDASGVETLRLSGPSPLLQSFLGLMETCKSLVGKEHVASAAALGRRQLWPIFILTRGRPETAHLNWHAEHVLGGLGEAGDGSSSIGCEDASPVVAVVSPEEEAEYRRSWPGALLLSLPEPGRSVGYARNVIKRALAWRAPFFWMCDDNLAAFMKIERDSDGNTHRVRDGPVFREAFMAVQRHKDISKIALGGFLRSNGTETTKTYKEVFGNIKIYKVCLLNGLQCEGIEYMPALANFEDIAFNRALLLRGRRTLKLQSYAYRVIMTNRGGCAAQRGVDADKPLVHSSYSEAELSAADRETVAQLQEWVAKDNHKPMPKRLQQKAEMQRRQLKVAKPRGDASAKQRAAGAKAEKRTDRATAEKQAGGGAKKRKAGRIAVSSSSSSSSFSGDSSDTGEDSDGDEESSAASDGSDLSDAAVSKAAADAAVSKADAAEEKSAAPKKPGVPFARKAPPPEPGDPTLHASELVIGVRVRVWWGAEHSWFHGKVTEVGTEILRGSRAIAYARVNYDDGDRTKHSLDELYCEGDAGKGDAGGVDGSADAASGTAGSKASMDDGFASSGPAFSTMHDVLGAAGDTDEDDDTPCTVCGKNNDPSHTLLCDGAGCERAYHIYCLSPPLFTVPEGKWLCHHCIKSWQVSEAGSRELARTLYEQDMRAVRNLRRQSTL